ncbi:MAG: glycosyltransferase [Acidimicrobiales bacterium]|nr:glycosyltransferase [Acidimicrobiales bacterium]
MSTVDETPPDSSVVAVVPAFDRADSVGATVEALQSIAAVARVIVVDDGSGDDTAAVAAGAGAQVVTLRPNQGKAAAVLAGCQATDADVLLFVDADTGSTAVQAERLVGPVLSGELDMSIAVLPAAGARGGFGLVRDFAAAVLQIGTGTRFEAPLSGQRCVRRSVVDALGPVDRFGLEVALTLDAAQAGLRAAEVEAEFDHRHTGRSLAGFRHRLRQGRDLYRAGASRLGHKVMVRALWSSVRGRFWA